MGWPPERGMDVRRARRLLNLPEDVRVQVRAARRGGGRQADPALRWGADPNSGVVQTTHRRPSDLARST